MHHELLMHCVQWHGPLRYHQLHGHGDRLSTNTGRSTYTMSGMGTGTTRSM